MADAEKHREYYQRPLPERYAAEQEQTAWYYGKGQSLFAGGGSAVEYPEDKIRKKQQSAAKEVYKEILYRSEAELIQPYADYHQNKAAVAAYLLKYVDEPAFAPVLHITVSEGEYHVGYHHKQYYSHAPGVEHSRKGGGNEYGGGAVRPTYYAHI